MFIPVEQLQTLEVYVVYEKRHVTCAPESTCAQALNARSFLALGERTLGTRSSLYRKWPNRRRLPNKRLLSNKRPSALLKLY